MTRPQREIGDSRSDVSFLADHQYRARCVSHDSLGDAAEQHMTQARPAMRTHDDQVHLFLFRYAANVPERLAGNDLRIDLHRSPLAFPDKLFRSGFSVRPQAGLELGHVKIGSHQHRRIARRRHHMQKEEPGTPLFCHRQGPSECFLGVLREIERDKDATNVHENPSSAVTVHGEVSEETRVVHGQVGASLPTTSTGQGACRTTRSATLPSNTWLRPVRPCEPMTIRSALSSSAIRQMSLNGSPMTNLASICTVLLPVLPRNSFARASASTFKPVSNSATLKVPITIDG